MAPLRAPAKGGAATVGSRSAVLAARCACGAEQARLAGLTAGGPHGLMARLVKFLSPLSWSWPLSFPSSEVSQPDDEDADGAGGGSGKAGAEGLAETTRASRA